MPVRLARTWLGGLRKVRKLWGHALLVPPRRYGPSVICTSFLQYFNGRVSAFIFHFTQCVYNTRHSCFLTSPFRCDHFFHFVTIFVTAAPTTTRRDSLKVAYEEMSTCHVHKNKIILYQASEQNLKNINFVNLWLNYAGPTYVIFMI